MNLFGVLAESPVVLEGYLALSAQVQQSSFSPEEQQLLLLTISRANGCGYCVAAHTAGGKRAGLDEAAIEAIRRGMPIPDSRLETLRRFAQSLIEKRGWIPEGELEAFLEAGFTKAQVLEVVLVGAMKTLSNYANHIFGTPLDEPLEAVEWKAPEAA